MSEVAKIAKTAVAVCAGEVNVVPDDWEVSALKDVFILTSGKAKTQKNLTKKTKDNIVPVFGGNGINGYCSEPMLTESTVVIGRVGEYCGVVHLSPEISWMTDNALYIKKLNVGFEQNFIFHQLTHASLDKLRSKGGQPLISQTPIYELQLAFPPLPEQQKIAQILTSVDEVIEKTQAQIDKLKDLKTGMMQELLTKGIGHVEFKDSPVGRIPVGWDACTVESVLTDIIDYRGKAPPKSESGVPLITAKNIRKGYINEDPKEYIFEEKFDDWMVRGMPIFGDVFITTEAPLGNVAKVPSYKFAIGQRVLTLRPKESIICTDFLVFILQSEVFRKELDLQSTGSTVAGIKQSTFRKVLLPVPTISEQKEIAKHISSIILRTSACDIKLKRFNDLKKALMQDLLTGKVRVNLD
jgi:type I restriction enzyme S subunit